MAGTPHRKQFSIQPVVEVDELLNDGLSVGSKPEIDGHFSSRKREGITLVSQASNLGQPQLPSSNVDPTTEANRSRISHVEAWINQELFGDMVEEPMQPYQDNLKEVYNITTLGKHVDEYIDMMDLMCTTCDSQPWLSYNGIAGLELRHMNVSECTIDDISLSRVDSECLGMYYDEPRLWCFS